MTFRYILSTILILWLALPLACQLPVNPDYQFILALTEEGKNREALYMLEHDKDLTNSDTINYLKGMNYYYLKSTDSAAIYLSAVSPSINFHTVSRFFAALNLLYSKKYEDALASFSTFNEDTLKKYGQLINLVRGGNYLLTRNYRKFDSISTGFLYDDFRYNMEQRRLVELKSKLISLKKKSPVMAGILSAILPGSGKFYAGKKGAALAAFAASTGLALISVETYYRSGPSATSPQFITAGALFTLFYVGNIIGSVHSVKQQIKSVNGRINNEILASIHVPVIRLVK